MKTRLCNQIALGLALAALPWVGACTQQGADPATNLVTAAQAEPAAPNTNAPASVAPTNAPGPDLAAKPAPAPDADKLKLPDTIKPSAALSEVIKLAQAGVDESVMLTFVTNSQNLFKLGADEIIYLKDIGVPDNVVTAMLERDHALQQALNEAAQAQAQEAAARAEAAAAQAQQAAASQAQQAASATASEAAAPSYVNPPAAQSTETVQQPSVTYNYNYFYNALAPYGSWIEVDGYGWCWRPTVVVIQHDWRPYCHGGRWIYTDLGWYWHSSYSWGWIAFHYGRWFHHPRWGWCWYPDYVWAPAWVTWRYSPGYCGWAPLPPGAWYRPGFGFYYHGRSVGVGFDFGLSAAWFTFVSWDRFCDSRPWHHRLPHSRVTQIINNTTIINNIVTGDNNTIINRGVPVDFARRRAGTEIRQVAVRTLTESKPVPRGRGEWLEEGGRTLAVRRLALPENAVAGDASPSRLRDASRAHPAPPDTKGAAAFEAAPRSRLANAFSRSESGPSALAPAPADSERPEARARTRETPAARPAVPTGEPPSVHVGPARARVESRSRDVADAENRSASRSAPLTLRGQERPNRTLTPSARPQPGPAVQPETPVARSETKPASRLQQIPTARTQPAPVTPTEQPPAAPPADPPARENVAPAPKPPSSSVVVIGRRDTERPGSRSATENRSPTLARNETSRTTHYWTPRGSDEGASAAAPSPRVEASRPNVTERFTPPSVSRPSSPSPRIERNEPSRVVTPFAPSTPRVERTEPSRNVTPFAPPSPPSVRRESPRIQMSAPPAPSAPSPRTFSAPAPVSPAPRAPSIAPGPSAPSLGPAPMRPAPSFAPAPAAPSFSAPPAPAPSAEPRSPARGGGEGGGRRVRDF
ncbi:MAG: hypothetical protein RMK20_08980 [Verrucomicrobiales bacterium]|nr:hypothetical protein [Verrucomicrobiales bacterium]